MNVTPPDSSLSSRYKATFTIQEVVNQLIVEDCQLIQCSYTDANKIDPVYIATIAFGLHYNYQFVSI
jgi:hypothetical protein